MIKKIITWLFLLCIIGIGFLLYYTGYFVKVVVEERDMGPYTLVYQEYLGDYATVGPVMDKISKGLIEDAQVTPERGFGIYYDDPATVAKEKLRSDIGVLLEEKDMDQLSLIKTKYKVKTFEKTKAVVAEFPYTSPLSVIAGVLKVYPELRKYVEVNKIHMSEVMEIYDRPAKKIYYIMPL